ncbi:MAG: hypothetical protein L0H93_04410 [Nocardioides sp.]|nr:hypothetical protein [Nocardioides sp.]
MSDLFCAANLVVVQDNGSVPTGERFAAVWCGPAAEAAASEVAQRLGLPVTVRPELESAPALAGVLQELADMFRGETVLLVAQSAEQLRSVDAVAPTVEGLDLGIRR